MSTVEASRLLFRILRQYNEVIGTDVDYSGKDPVIVVHLEKKTKSILEKIPPIFKGNKVKTIVDSPYFSL